VSKQPRRPIGRRLQASVMGIVNVPIRIVLGLPVATPLGRRLMLAFIVGRKSGKTYQSASSGPTGPGRRPLCVSCWASPPCGCRECHPELLSWTFLDVRFPWKLGYRALLPLSGVRPTHPVAPTPLF